MSDLLSKEKIKKKDFNKKMIESFGFDNLYTSPYTEDGQKLTLYYVEGAGDEYNGVKGPLHVGTWTKGQGWIFSYAKKCLINEVAA